MKRLISALLVGITLCAHIVNAMQEPVIKKADEIGKMSSREIARYKQSIFDSLERLNNDPTITARVKARKQQTYLEILSALEQKSAPTPATSGAKPSDEPKKKITWKELKSYAKSLDDAVKSIETALGISSNPLDDKKKAAQNVIMKNIVTQTAFDEENLNAPSTAAEDLTNTLKQPKSAENIVRALMDGFCVKAGEEATSAGSSRNIVDEINAKFKTTIPADANADALLELAVKAPLG